MEQKNFLRELIGDIQDYGCDVSDGKKKVSNKTLAEHLEAHGVMIRPAVPGKNRDDYDMDERIFRNGENRMKDKVVDRLVELRRMAGSPEVDNLLSEIIREVRLL
jgi:hypothetical protein